MIGYIYIGKKGKWKIYFTPLCSALKVHLLRWSQPSQARPTTYYRVHIYVLAVFKVRTALPYVGSECTSDGPFDGGR